MDAKITLLIFVLSSVSLYAADTGGFQKIEPNKVPDELAMLAAVTKANYEKIKSWQGKITDHFVRVSRGSIAADELKQYTGVKLADEPNEIYEVADDTSEFKVDMENNRFFRYMNRPEPLVCKDPRKGAT